MEKSYERVAVNSDFLIRPFQGADQEFDQEPIL